MRVTRGKSVIYIVWLIWTIQTIRFFLMGGVNSDETSIAMKTYSIIYVLALAVAMLLLSLIWIYKNWDKPLIKKNDKYSNIT